MSTSSYSSVVSSSSSGNSSSGSSSSDRTSFTGSFSGASLSSCSTIVAPQPSVRPFGCPEYNYYWIENKSRSNPKKSYFYNYRSHAVVWQRPLPKDVSLPLYTSTWGSERPNIQEDEDELVVSDAEETWQKKKRLQIKQRNRQLITEDASNCLQLLSLEKVLKSKRLLDVVWKLHRLPGESVRDLKKRLQLSTVDDVKIKEEVLSDNECIIQQDLTNVPLKQEPPDIECIEQNQTNETVVKDLTNDFDLEQVQANLDVFNDLDMSDSDSDPENIAALMKQEFMMNFEDSELESNDEDDDDEEDEGNNYRSKRKVKNKNKGAKAVEIVENLEDVETEEESDYEEEEEEIIDRPLETLKQEFMEQDNLEDDGEDYENQRLVADLLEIEINESDQENEFFNSCNDLVNHEDTEENINWTFERTSEFVGNSLLTQEVLNPFATRKIKKVVKKKVPPNDKKKVHKKTKPEPKKVPKLVIKKDQDSNYQVQTGNAVQEDGAIVCNMYGTRTLNYNHPPRTKVSSFQQAYKLSGSEWSDSDCEESKNPRSSNVQKRLNSDTSDASEAEFEKPKEGNGTREKKIPPLKINLKKKGAEKLELKNWFPKQKLDKRRRSGQVSDSSWCASDISGCSDIDDTDITLVKMKKEKKSDSDIEMEKKEDEEDEEYYYRKFKKEKHNSSEKPPRKRSKKSKSWAPTLDLNLVKDETKCPEEFSLEDDYLGPPKDDSIMELSSHPPANISPKPSPPESIDTISQPAVQEETNEDIGGESTTKMETNADIGKESTTKMETNADIEKESTTKMETNAVTDESAMEVEMNTVAEDSTLKTEANTYAEESATKADANTVAGETTTKSESNTIAGETSMKVEAAHDAPNQWTTVQKRDDTSDSESSSSSSSGSCSRSSCSGCGSSSSSSSDEEDNQEAKKEAPP